jgi:23S rRNA (uridine2552-2'-O)-methyltransferase
VAVDKARLTLDTHASIEVVQADVFELESDALAALGPFHVVLSDMAPATTGSKAADQARSMELFMRALHVASCCGSARSSFVGKLFMGPDFAVAKRAVAAAYAAVRVVRPAGTRRQSSEVFLVGIDRAAPERSA